MVVPSILSELSDFARKRRSDLKKRKEEEKS
jgi:hypothetical protein